MQYLTNDEIEKFCAANGVTSKSQRAAVHDAVRAMEQAEGKLALVRMQESAEEETKRFLSNLPEDTYKTDEYDRSGSHQRVLAASAKIYEEALCNHTLKAALQVMIEMGYTRPECKKIEEAVRFRIQLRP